MKFKNQKEMFEWIWENREHISEISGNKLFPKGFTLWHWQFAHVLPKGSYPHYKLNPDNIMLMLPDEHENQECFDKYNERKQELKREYYEKYYRNSLDN